MFVEMDLWCQILRPDVALLPELVLRHDLVFQEAQTQRLSTKPQQKKYNQLLYRSVFTKLVELPGKLPFCPNLRGIRSDDKVAWPFGELMMACFTMRSMVRLCRTFSASALGGALLQLRQPRRAWAAS